VFTPCRLIGKEFLKLKSKIKEVKQLKKFIPKEKLGKRAKKEEARKNRVTWAFSPVTRQVDSKKRYKRKQKSRIRLDNDEAGFFVSSKCVLFTFIAKNLLFTCP
jgi:hypothetical protein